MTWLDRQRESAPAELAARIEWYRTRHHCWDPEGRTHLDTNIAVDAVIALWREGTSLRADADLLEIEAQNTRSLADEKDDQAEDMWKVIAEQRPEWRDAFIEQVDPRTTPPEEGDMK